MKIDEAVIGAVLDVLKGEFGSCVHLDDDQWRGVAHDVIAAALPPAEPTTTDPRDELLEAAWGVIANVNGGDWVSSVCSEEWIGAASRWSDRYSDLVSGRVLPPAEPGRDRIAVVTGQNGAWGIARFNGHAMDERDWRDMEADAENLGGAHPPFARAIIRCDLPRPAEPVEVSGTVEGVP